MSNFDPSLIELEQMRHMFEYEKISRELDACDDPDVLRNAAKCFLKLQMKTQETLQKL
tara:strand:- start:385 stop:558 length:174 start_codon:yes stop_codon:yes gene_type:complete